MLTPDTPRLLACLFALGAVLLFGQAVWYYLIGDYTRILLPALFAPLLLTAALMRLGQQETARLSVYLVLACSYLLIATSLPQDDTPTLLWLGLPPVLTLLLLPLGQATLLNLVLAPIWLLLANLTPPSSQALGYVALVAASGLAPWGIRHHHALWLATDPRDQKCAALKAAPLLERLESEAERADLLDHRLAVAVLHLPQLEMAGEQFGGLARQALLNAFCRTVSEHSRDHDLLGRIGDADFWLVMPGTSENGALLVRQRIEEAASVATLHDTGGIEIRGAICSHSPGEPFRELKRRLESTTQRLADC
ncbi:GGDEF domain-containing protein [Halomonas sp. PAR8]|uniref:GGDEF domain-containing protein n=1 Tax=Halomonas sp. PAR8 TaxID=3075515 RepID=UPI0028888FEF|nr:GGDEF domain-containing protein [Halomonas sp. PAR8]MDT0591659.1 GGDEF domain-containing protein [Halomonas sp. PAR8]